MFFTFDISSNIKLCEVSFIPSPPLLMYCVDDNAWVAWSTNCRVVSQDTTRILREVWLPASAGVVTENHLYGSFETPAEELTYDLNQNHILYGFVRRIEKNYTQRIISFVFSPINKIFWDDLIHDFFLKNLSIFKSFSNALICLRIINIYKTNPYWKQEKK